MPAIPTCPNCGQEMVIRQRYNDGAKFWGCAGFPNCRGTRNYIQQIASADSSKPLELPEVVEYSKLIARAHRRIRRKMRKENKQ